MAGCAVRDDSVDTPCLAIDGGAATAPVLEKLGFTRVDYRPAGRGLYTRTGATFGGGRFDVLQGPQGNGTDPVSIPAPPQPEIERSTMKFRVTRTSQYRNNAPCPEAHHETYIRTERHRADFPGSGTYYRNLRQTWLSVGTNHRTEGEYITRDVEYDGWYVELDTLDALCQFEARHGPILIQSDRDHPGNWLLEIYDEDSA